MSGNSFFFKSCLTCDAIETNRYRRPWCKLKSCFVWASGGCDRWRKKGTGNAEDYTHTERSANGGFYRVPLR